MLKKYIHRNIYGVDGMKIKKRRGKVRCISYAAVLLCVLVAWGASETVKRKNAQIQISVTQQRALSSLSESFDNIESNLNKASFAGTGEMLAEISQELRSDAGTAKWALSILDSGDTQLFNVYKFLSQVGAYSASLAEKLDSGEKLQQKDSDTLASLMNYSKTLSNQFTYMNDMMDSGAFSFEEIEDTVSYAAAKDAPGLSYLSASSDAEQSVTDFPTLIYDGPFSDNVLKKESELLKSSQSVSADAAKEKAASILGVDKNSLTENSGQDGKLAAYCFYVNGFHIAITKNGGYLSYIIGDSFSGAEKTDGEQAVESAKKLLEKAGYKNMKETYYATIDGICTVNFAYMQNDYICYTDLIKVSVSLDTGYVVSMDASDYLMNHIERDIPQNEAEVEKAALKINPLLKIKGTKKAVIPTEYGSEQYAYEFLCTDGKNDALVYIDTVSLEENEILLLLYSDGGTLTK